VETVDGGFNRLTGMDAAKVAEAMADLSMPDERPQYYGDGHAADAIVRALVAELG
jgi:UDP-N-acetylglucosamine 2-epimerase